MRPIIEAALPLPRRAARRRVPKDRRQFAARLRRNPTKAFNLLWTQLRARRLRVKFHRRAVLHSWIVDFWCPEKRIAVEIDYPSDFGRVAAHRHRDRALSLKAIRVLRVPADRVYDNLDQVVREITLMLV